MSVARLRAKVYFVVVYLGAFAGHLPWLLAQARRKTEFLGTDFTIFYAGWTLVLRGRARELYELGAQRAAERALLGDVQFPGGVVPFLHPPHAALAFAPLALLARTPATWAWTAAQLVLLAWLIRRIVRLVDARAASDRWLVAAALLAFPPVFASLQMGQLSVLLTVALLELVLAVEDGRDGAATAWLLLLSVKPHFVLVPLAVLVAQRRWSLLGRAAALAGGVAAATMLVLGASIYREWLAALPRLEPLWGNAGPEFMVNVRGAATRLLGAGAPVPGGFVLAGLVGATVAAYAVARRAARGATAGDGWPVALALGLLFAPHLFLHDALLWVVPLALHLRGLRARGADVTPFAMFVLSWPFAGLVNEAVERSGRLLPVHLLVVEALVATAWMSSATRASGAA